MSLQRYSASRDANEPEIVNYLREKCRVKIYRLPKPLDLIVQMRDGTLILMEIKMPGKRHTPAQVRFLESWCAKPAPIFTVHSIEEAEAVIQAMEDAMPEDISDCYREACEWEA